MNQDQTIIFGAMTPLEPELELYVAGEAILREFVSRPKWVRRRVDQLTFLDHLTGRLRSAVDLDLERHWQTRGPHWRNLIVLPVHTLSRSRDHLMSLSLDSGVPLAQLSRREERCLVAAGLVVKFLELAPLASEIPSFFDSDEAIYDWVLRRIDPTMFGARRGGTAPESEAGPGLPAAWLELVDFFSANRLVLLALPVDADASEHLIAAVKPTDGEDSGRVLASGRPDMPATGRFYIERDIDLPPDRLRVGALTDRRPLGRVKVRFKANGAASCESYHLSVVPPPQVFVERIDILITQRLLNDAKTVAPGAGSESKIMTYQSWYASNDPALTQAHAFVANETELLSSSPVVPDEAIVAVSLRPMTLGLMRSGLLMAVLAAAVLVTITLVAGWRLAGWGGIGVPLVPPDINSLVTIVVLGPTLLAGLMLRQEEHLFTKRVAASHRAGLVLQVALTTTFAVIYASGVRGGVLGVLSVALSGVSILLALYLYILYSGSRRILKRPRVSRTTLLGRDEYIATLRK